MVKIHVLSDNRHVVYFIDHILPFFEKRFEETGTGIYLFFGSSDRSLGSDKGEILLKAKSITRLCIENCNWNIRDNNEPKKLLQIPLGIAMRQNLGEHAKLLRHYINSVAANATSWHSRIEDKIYFCFGNSYGERDEWFNPR